MKKFAPALLGLLTVFTVTNANAQGPEASAIGIHKNYSEVTELKNATIKALDPNGYTYDFTNLNINTPYSEHATAFYKDKVIIASAKKIGAFFSKRDKNTNEGFHNLYCGDLTKNGVIKHLVNFSRAINSKEHHEGSITLSSKETVAYFTRSVEENGQHNLKIYRAEMIDYQWKNIEMLPFNKVGYAIENPVLSPDNKTIYFSSNIPGSKGGFDLFSVTINNDGTYGNPQNLGNEINTEKDERFPYVMADNSALYFSSNGHYSIGGLDIFESKMINNEFTSPVNMGSTLNSAQDDFGFLMNTNNSGFFTSNRNGGKGGNDVYYFKREKTTQTIQGVVVDFKTNTVLPNATVEVVDAYGRIIQKINTDKKGAFTTEVVPYNSYTLLASKDGFENSTQKFESFRGDNYDHVMTIKLLQTEAEIVEIAKKKIIKIENIYFDSNKWRIKEESMLSLNKIVTVLEENPNMKIMINAHTDARGNDQYNMTLSVKRAQSAKAYLIKKGIKKERLVSKGYGETSPIENCGAKCSEAQHDANRRIEFVIVE